MLSLFQDCPYLPLHYSLRCIQKACYVVFVSGLSTQASTLFSKVHIESVLCCLCLRIVHTGLYIILYGTYRKRVMLSLFQDCPYLPLHYSLRYIQKACYVVFVSGLSIPASTLFSKVHIESVLCCLCFRIVHTGLYIIL